MSKVRRHNDKCEPVNNTMTVEYDEQVIDDSKIIEIVEKTGYGASIYTDSSKASSSTDKSLEKKATSLVEEAEKELKARVIISFVFLLPLFYIAMGPMIYLPIPSWLTGHENALSFAFTQFLLTLPIIYVNRKYYKVGFKTLFKGNPNMDSLIAIGSGTALVYGIFAIYRIGYGLGHGYGYMPKYLMTVF